ncbi:hypothetical protein [Roseibacillus ishigakijimensis]|uniref:Sulfotransferase family protein n=1 Tax=Roseibacillus ishigakijimensis TaxID=454146 RepID=A0A934VLN5_9BACT|nr:hypothetical protein [Roseibacillus ishigakijimensis]MBK1833075.1 hypothetical protein [Roseibacillus ishigakijimensis]
MIRPSFLVFASASAVGSQFVQALQTQRDLSLAAVGGDLRAELAFWALRQAGGREDFAETASGEEAGLFWQGFFPLGEEWTPWSEQETPPRVILFLEPPVTAMRAWHHALLAASLENKVSFREALVAEEPRRDGREWPRRNPYPPSLQYRQRARFATLIGQAREAVGSERVKVLLSEDWEKDPAAVGREVLAFLGKSPDHELAIPPLPPQRNLRGTHHFDQAVSRLAGRLPGGRVLKSVFGKTWQDRYQALSERIFAPMSDWRIDSMVEDELLEEFQPEVRALGELLGRDLSHWNEPRFPRSEHHHEH